MCVPSLHTLCCARPHACVKFTMSALAVPAPDIQAISVKTALRGPCPRMMAAPEAGTLEWAVADREGVP